MLVNGSTAIPAMSRWIEILHRKGFLPGITTRRAFILSRLNFRQDHFIPNFFFCSLVKGSTRSLLRKSDRGIAAFQSLAVLSEMPASINFPSGEKATLFTLPIKPVNSCISCPFKFHHFAVLSLAPVRMDLPSGANATEITWKLCPVNSRTSFPSRVHSCATNLSLLPPPVSTHLLSGEK